MEKEKLDSTKESPEKRLFSLDVVSIFTNIPLDIVLESIMKRWNKLRRLTKIPRHMFIDIIKFCILDNNYFIYEDQNYKQKFWLAMGNSLSPILSHFVLEDILTRYGFTKDKNQSEVIV